MGHGHGGLEDLSVQAGAGAQGVRQDLRRPQGLPVLGAAGQQGVESLPVGLAAVLKHALVRFEGLGQVATPNAGGHQAGVGLGIEPESEALRIVVEDLQGRLKIAAAAVEFDEDGHREVGGRHASFPRSGTWPELWITALHLQPLLLQSQPRSSMSART